MRCDRKSNFKKFDLKRIHCGKSFSYCIVLLQFLSSNLITLQWVIEAFVLSINGSYKCVLRILTTLGGRL